MICFICHGEVKSASSILIHPSSKAAALVFSRNPLDSKDDIEDFDKITQELRAEGWKNGELCESCLKVM